MRRPIYNSREDKIEALLSDWMNDGDYGTLHENLVYILINGHVGFNDMQDWELDRAITCMQEGLYDDEDE